MQLLRENILSCAQLVAPAADDYVAIVEDLAARGLRGGVVYDAVIARAAEISQVDYLVTFNTQHFQQVWPAGIARIVAPQALPIS